MSFILFTRGILPYRSNLTRHGLQISVYRTLLVYPSETNREVVCDMT